MYPLWIEIVQFCSSNSSHLLRYCVQSWSHSWSPTRMSSESFAISKVDHLRRFKLVITSQRTIKSKSSLNPPASMIFPLTIGSSWETVSQMTSVYSSSHDSTTNNFNNWCQLPWKWSWSMVSHSSIKEGRGLSLLQAPWSLLSSLSVMMCLWCFLGSKMGSQMWHD